MFTIIALLFLVCTFLITYLKDSVLFGAIFCIELFLFTGIYLFKFLNLGEMSIEALSTKVKFIKNSASEVEQDIEVIKKLKESSKIAEKDILKIKSEMFILKDKLEDTIEKPNRWQ